MVKSVKSCKIYHASTSSRVIVTLHKNFPFSHSKVCPWLASKNPPPTDLRPLWNSWRPVMQVVVQMAAVKTAIHYITEWNMHDSHTTSHMQSIQKGMLVAMICNKKLILSSFHLTSSLSCCFPNILFQSNTDTRPIFISCLHNQLAMWHQQMCFSFSTLYQSLAPGNKLRFLHVSRMSSKFRMEMLPSNLLWK